MEEKKQERTYNVSLLGDVVKDLSYNLYFSSIPVIRDLTISNEGEEDLKNLRLTITSEPAFMKEVSIDLPYVPGRKDLDLGDITARTDNDILLRLKERSTGTISLTLFDDVEIMKKEFSIELLPIDEWPGFGDSPEITAAFSQPDDPVVSDIYKASLEHFRKETGKESFRGYEESTATVSSFIKSVYTVIDGHSIKYMIPPQDYAVTGQKVRFPEEIMETMFANNLDITMLFSSVLEKAGLNPVVIFIRDHACLGVFLRRETFSETVVYDATSLIKRTATGMNDMIVFNPVTAMEGVEETYEDSMEDAMDRISEEEGFLCAVDIRRGRSIGIRPVHGDAQTGAEGTVKDVETDKETVKDGPISGEVTSETAVDKDSKTGEGSDEGPETEGISEVTGEIPLTGEDSKEPLKKRLWERKLLDISLRNNLINLRMTKGTIQVVAPTLTDLLDALEEGKEISILSRPEDWDRFISDLDKNTGRELSMFKDFAKEEFKDYRLRSLISREELEERGTRIMKGAKLSMEENGANTFYLVLGLLKYVPAPGDGEKYAPLVMVPVDIASRITGNGFIIKAREEDTVINFTLLELLKQEYSIDLSILDPLPLKEDGSVDLIRVFTVIRKAIMNESGWDIREEACLGLFSFMRFIMWNDVRNNFQEFMKNDLVRSLVEGKMVTPQEVIELKEDFVEDANKKVNAIFPVSSDASQALAVMASKEGKSFVLHGPPGTGKSQTITNIIANALVDGKKVLFCAQKMAALEVVEKRLNDMGIGSFCLEIHSSKAKKKSVLDQLENSMKITKLKKTEELSEVSSNLDRRRDELNSMVISLYRKDETGYSVYDLLSKYASLKDFDKFLKLGDDFDPSNLKEKEELLTGALNLGSHAGGPYGHPLLGVEKVEFTPGLREEIESSLDADFAPAGEALTALVRQDMKLDTLEEIDALAAFSEGALALMDKEPSVFSLSHIDQAAEELKGIADRIDEIGRVRKELTDSFREEILKLDADALKKEFEEGEDKFIVARMLYKNPVLKEINSLSRSHVYKKEEIPEVIDRLRRFHTLKTETVHEIGSKNEILHGTLGTMTDSDPRNIRDLAGSIGEFIEKNRGENLERFLSLTDDPAFRTKAERFTGEYRKIEKNIREFNESTAYRRRTEDNLLTEIAGRKEEILSGLDSLRDWIRYRAAYEDARRDGLSLFLNYYENGEVREDELLPAFRKSVYREILIRRLGKEKGLVNLTGRTIEEKVDELDRLTKEYQLLEKKHLYQTLSSRIPNLILESATSQELNVLQKAIRSGARNLSIRKLFKDTRNLLGRIAPCMLMSPMSVAQFLEPQYGMFDLVVFDEASQVPTAEAVGAIGRGVQSIIVGDPKQLPPTSFFMTRTMTDEDETIEEEDLDNILEDCLALSMTESYLLWHYRSRHESLIAFSNRNFYDNMLYTYPSPLDMVSKVTYRRNDGIYDRGGTRTNETEAREIVEETVARLKSGSPLSMGIVTFSSVQQTLIEKLLSEKFRENPELEAAAMNSGEPLFVKNLENVQGDERDVILFSVGYGADKDGSISLNFGPINQDGGWRRLNVAVSRARHEMVVFTNIDPDLFNVSRSSARGVRDLKSFLQYARDGRRKVALKDMDAELQDVTLSGIIAERLREEGFKVETSIGSSKFKVDMGIVHPDNPDAFILGIMCGGPSYREAQSSYDREILQRSVLKGLGWNLHTIYPLDYMDNEEAEIRKIKELVETLRRKSMEKPTGIMDDIPTVETELITAGIPEEVPYMMNDAPERIMSMDEFMKVTNSADIHKDLKRVIEMEGPISLSLLTKRAKKIYGLFRITDKTKKQVEMVLNKEKPYFTMEGEEIVYWKDEESRNRKTFRRTLPDDQDRLFTEISREEIENAIGYILSGEDLSEKNLIRSVTTLLGYPRLNVENESYTKNILDIMLLEKRLTRNSAGLFDIPEAAVPAPQNTVPGITSPETVPETAPESEPQSVRITGTDSVEKSTEISVEEKTEVKTEESIEDKIEKASDDEKGTESVYWDQLRMDIPSESSEKTAEEVKEIEAGSVETSEKDSRNSTEI